MPVDRETIDDVATLKNEVEHMKEELKELIEWKRNCSLVVAGWGAVCMFLVTVGGIVAEYYTQIKTWLMSYWGHP